MSTFDKAKLTQKAIGAEVNWATAYEELLPRVFHYFCLRTGNRLDAEDLTAATFERAWRDRQNYRKDIGAFTNWLFGIAHHVLITHYRRDRSMDSPTEKTSPDILRAIEDDAVDRENFTRIAAILESFAEREREIFSLKYGAQFTNRSIARTLGLTESNVGTILHRIVSHLRKELEHENE